MAEEAAQDRADPPGSGAAEALRLSQDELIGIPCRQALEGDVPRSEAVGEKGPDGGNVPRDGCRFETALIQQETFVPARNPLDRSVVSRTAESGRDPAGPTQPAQQLAGVRPVDPAPVVRPAFAQECLDPLLIESFDRELLAREPAAQVRKEPQFTPGNGASIALGREMSSKSVDIPG